MATKFVGKLNVGGTDLEIVSTLQLICETNASTSAKYIGKLGFDALHLGMTIHVWFKYTNTASSPTLDINGTGAHSIYLHGTTPVGTSPAESWYADSIVTMTLRGTSLENSAWVIDNYRAMSQSSAVWGAITGDLTNQSDLSGMLNTLTAYCDNLNDNKQRKYDAFYTVDPDTLSYNTQHVAINRSSIEIKTPTSGGGSATLTLYGHSKLGLSPTVLWTNSSPTASFEAQVVTLSQSLSNFSFYDVIVRVNTSEDYYTTSGLIPIDKTGRITMALDRNYVRNVATQMGSGTVGTSFRFGPCTRYTTYGSTTVTNQNGFLIPYQIIGWK